MKITIKKPDKLKRIQSETWDTLTLIEKDFVIYLNKGTTKYNLMRRLHISDNSGLWRLRKRVTNKLQGDIDKINERHRNSIKNE